MRLQYASMNHHGIADELSLLLATEIRSLVHHLGASTPHLTAKTYPIWNDLKLLVEISEQHAERLSLLLDRLDLPPRPRPYPVQVAQFHYLTIEYLLLEMIEEKKGQLAAYRRAISHAGLNEDLVTELQSLLDENVAQLDSFEQCQRTLDTATSPVSSD